MDEDDLLWTVAASGSAIGAAVLAKKVLSSSWTKRRGSVPGNPATSDTSWSEALMWAMVSGVVVGIVRLLAQRGVAAAFVKAGRGLPSNAADKPTA